MAEPDYEFIDGFTKYQTALDRSNSSFLSNNGWLGTSTRWRFRDAFVGSGRCLYYNESGTYDPLYRQTPSTMGRCVGGLWVRGNVAGSPTIAMPIFTLATTSALTSDAQISIAIEADGSVSAKRGYIGTIVGQSSAGLIGNWDGGHCIEWDIAPKNSGGYAKVWVDGVQVVNYSGDTANEAGDGYSYYGFNPYRYAEIAHFYSRHYLSSTAAGETPFLTQPIIDTDFPASEIDINFPTVYDVIGNANYTNTDANYTSASNIHTVREIAPQDGVIDRAYLTFTETSAGGKVRAVVYATSGSNATTFLGASDEVIGWTADTQITFTFSTPVPVTAGVAYHIGFITDTANVGLQYDGDKIGRRYAITYASTGALADASSGFVDDAPLVWCRISSVTNTAVVMGKVPPVGGTAYAEGSTAGTLDLFGFAELPFDPTTIHAVQLCTRARKTDAGVKQLSSVLDIGGTKYEGSAPDSNLTTTATMWPTIFNKNPATSAAWTKAAIDGSDAGYRIEA